MTGREWLYVLSAVVIVVFYVAGLAVAVRALFGERSVASRRCLRCLHDLTHTEGVVCGECGFEAQRASQLVPRRRRPVKAVIAILACAVLTIGLISYLPGHRWTEFVPTRVLVALMPLQSDPEGDVSDEIRRRIDGDTLTNGQWTALVRRSASGDWAARPSDPQWADKYAEFVKDWNRRQRDRPDLRDPKTLAAVLHLPPSIEVITRDAWPRGAAPWIEVQVEHWWPIGNEWRVRVSPGRAEPATSFSQDRLRARAREGFAVPPLESTGSIDVRVEVQRWEAGVWRPAAERVMPVEIELVETGLQPVSNAALADAIRAGFGRSPAHVPGDGAPPWFDWEPQPMAERRFAGVAVGFRMELLRNDDVVMREGVWCAAGPGDHRGLAGEERFVDPKLSELVRENARWTLRVTADPELALRSLAGPTCWAGSFSMELEIRELADEFRLSPTP